MWSIEGALITPEGINNQGLVTIDGEKIARVTSTRGASPACSIKIDGIILPGLVDLHNHLTWDVLPRWHPSHKFANRTEWRELPEFKEALFYAEDKLVWQADSLGCQANLYAEVKAVVGGATAVVGSYEDGCVAGLVRNLDQDSGLRDTTPALSAPLQAAPQGFPAAVKTCSAATPVGNSIVDVAVNEIDLQKLPPARLAFLRCQLANGTLRSFLVHVAEGKPNDQPSLDEFAQVQELDLLRPGLVIIHGSALRQTDFAAIKAGGAGLVWSPHSEIELYGVTLDIPAAKAAGVTIAIAPDWSPTGSEGMLQELNYARANFSDFNAEQLTRMATAIPAKLARIDDRIGQLKPGLYADLLVIRRKEGSPYESVVTASPADVQLVVIDGRPVYGDSALMQQLAPGKKLVPMTICGAPKAIDLDGTTAAQSSWEAVKARLQQRLSQGSYPKTLAPLGCPLSKGSLSGQ